MRKRLISVFVILAFLLSLIPINLIVARADTLVPAFPGAEGAGMYTTGGRGGDVYEVTNLNDSGPGSLRDGVKLSNVTIVFRVSGTIHLKSELVISGSNITIAGQTAPGDGITIAGYGVRITGSNIIIRYLRFRPGSANIGAEPDALTSFGGSKNIIIDHCSFSWSVDETLSIYRVENLTVQWCIAAESLTMSGHWKGRHGYGGIWGGYNATWHHNLLMNHTSRLPRVNVGSAPIPEAKVEFINNVIYNWGFNNTYGGENTTLSLINNYYKPGPGTQDSVKSRIANPTPNGYPSSWYVSGNVLEGNNEVTTNNEAGIIASGQYTKLTEPVDIPGSVTVQDAQTAYQEVLAKAGAVYPKRDAVDARLVNEVKNGLGRFINTEAEVGGYPELSTVQAPQDSDHDGMPDSWEIANGLNPNDPSDRNGYKFGNGYTNLENYLNSLVDMNHAPQNPEVQIINPNYNALVDAGAAVKIEARAKALGGAKITKVVFYDNGVKIGEDTTEPYSYTIGAIEEGTHYLVAVAYDSNGLSTQSTAVRVFANGPEVKWPWKVADIGSPAIKTSASLDNCGTLTLKANGKIGGSTDTFGYVYRKVYGDAELIAKIDYMEKVDHNAFAGLMVRSSLDPGAVAAYVAKSYVKADKLTNPTAVRFIARQVANASMANTGDVDSSTPNTVVNVEVSWMKIKKSGSVVEAAYSLDSRTWNVIGRYTLNIGDEYYIGFAVDSAQATNQIYNYNIAKFSNISLTTSDNFIEIYNPENDYTNVGEYKIKGYASVDGKITVTNASSTDTKNVDVSGQTEFEVPVQLVSGNNTISVNLQTVDGSKTRQIVLNVVYDNQKPVISWVSKPQPTVLSSAYSLVLSSNEDAYVTIMQNNMVVYQNDYVKANSPVTFNIDFEKGRNKIEIIIKDFSGNTTTESFDVIYLANFDIMVDKNYTGNDGDIVNGVKIFKTVQAAVNSVPSNNTKRVIIFIKSGRYYEKITINSPNISLIGEDPFTTILTYDVAAGTPKPDGSGTYGTSGSASVTINSGAINFTAENITFENAFDENQPISSKQAVAVRSLADKMVFKNCRFIGNQDTLYADAGRQYFKNCYIEGDVDFIFGAAQAVFENSTIFSVDRPGITPKGYITAASTRKSDNFGFLFVNCKFLSNVTVANSVYLGRPWHPSADLNRWVNVVIRESYLGDHINDYGWTSMSSTDSSGNTIWFYPQNERFYEYKNYGPGAKINEYRPQLDDVMAQVYTKQNVLDGWDADSFIDTIYDPIKVYIRNSQKDSTTKMNYSINITVDSDCELTVKRGNEVVYTNPAYTANTQVTVPVALADGTNNILVIASKAGENVVKLLTVDFINYAPEITVLQAPVSKTTRSTVTVKAKISKNGTVTFKRNGETLGSLIVEANKEFSFDYSLVEGENSLDLVVVDEGGNVRITTFKVVYEIDWGSNAFTVQIIQVKNIAGTSLSTIGSNKDIIVTINVKNNTGLRRNGTIIVGIFDSKGILVAYAGKKISIEAGKTITYKAGLKVNNVNGPVIKAYIVDTLKTKGNLSNIATFK
ncbi:Pectinesterase [Caldicellulosiruptor owensensis OL]|uniref:Pectinesterase n=1 Tax=Caldicellulosiruptor owensensis (strain ATCC 700167 / DSM 13100 / OL) TaxID=632518 RepID=E4Q6L4_CALOW|nr:pectinesterase family protein [Caldicellulosiruptor owensensis]ADQ05621.1 Pectinesterase [Caldicellulosiruptor owensensis OL]